MNKCCQKTLEKMIEFKLTKKDYIKILKTVCF